VTPAPRVHGDASLLSSKLGLTRICVDSQTGGASTEVVVASVVVITVVVASAVVVARVVANSVVIVGSMLMVASVEPVAVSVTVVSRTSVLSVA
jgi:hypothetical protein